jgi:type II secretory pathway predicted ATPase ExeA
MQPFSISPNPISLYLTASLKTVVAKVRYTIDERQGLTCILGDVGMGKSSVLRLLYTEYAANEEVMACLIPTPNFASEFAFLKAVCHEFGLGPKRSLYDQESLLKGFLMDKFVEKKNVVVFIDEAQRLNGKMLEQVRAMLNFETNQEKLIQFVLSGQLELRDRLRDPSKKAIRSRIFAPSILDPLSRDETEAMIAHRCNLASIKVPLSSAQITAIYNQTSGVPREILKICAVVYQLMKAKKESLASDDTIAEALADAKTVWEDEPTEEAAKA